MDEKRELVGTIPIEEDVTIPPGEVEGELAGLGFEPIAGVVPTSPSSVVEAAFTAVDVERRIAKGTPRNGPLVLVKEEPRARSTGWAVACSEHGAFEVLLPGKGLAVSTARDHLSKLHAGMGRIVTKHLGSKPRGKAKRRTAA